MKRLHVHIRVEDIESARRFYSTLFGAEPTVLKADYVKWSLDDPRVNFAVSNLCGGALGVDHLGIQADSDEELEELHGRLADARVETLDEVEANCCYARSNKHWARDPQGVVWEMFHTMGDSVVYGDDHAPMAQA